jgi:TRAP-type C4-dicarboxylate transport system substrate-binding protein
MLLWVGALLAVRPAVADPARVLRIATSAPDGTTYSRELKAFGREIEAATHGAITVRWIFGGLAGDELQAGERMTRNQLDGIASGGMLCEKNAPTFRVLHLLGLYRSRDEVDHVSGRLRSEIDQELRQHGLVYLTDAALGPTDLFLRRPLRTFEEIKAETLWVWDADRTQWMTLRQMGFRVLTLPLEAAATAYDEGKHQGFFSIPSATLLFQWSHRAHYFAPVQISFLTGCLLISQRVFDSLTHDQQQIVREASARVRVRLSDAVQRQDDELVGGLFERQGLTPISTAKTLRERFFAEAAEARRKLGDTLLPTTLQQRAEELLTGYRKSH